MTRTILRVTFDPVPVLGMLLATTILAALIGIQYLGLFWGAVLLGVIAPHAVIALLHKLPGDFTPTPLTAQRNHDDRDQ